MSQLAIIGGSALEQFEGFTALDTLRPQSEFGVCSAPIVRGSLEGQPLLFLSRHGVDHELAPHRINYRANIDCLQRAGATQVIAINTVGSLNPKMVPGDLVLPDQLIDYTWGREGSFHDGEHRSLRHIDFTWPFDRRLSEQLASVAAELGLRCHRGATYGCTQGPRLETAAEIRRMARDGCDLVGMTAAPEAALAAELGLRYASICAVVNPAAGLSGEVLEESEILAVAHLAMAGVRDLIRRFLLTAPVPGR